VDEGRGHALGGSERERTGSLNEHPSAKLKTKKAE
jgi:hypothetical protein